jgi:methionyl-tRNA synthetase
MPNNLETEELVDDCSVVCPRCEAQMYPPDVFAGCDPSKNIDEAELNCDHCGTALHASSMVSVTYVTRLASSDQTE